MKLPKRPLHTAKWRRLSAQVVAEEPVCQLNMAGCTHYSEQADHIIPVSVAPHLVFVRANLQGACAWCNNLRGNRDLVMLRKPKALSFFE